MPLGTMSEGSDNIDPAIEAALRTLSRYLVQKNWKATYLAHKAVYKIGRPAIEPIRNALQRTGWSNIKYAIHVRLVAGLISVLHDIDESESRKMAALMKQTGCDPAVVRILDSICSFTNEDYYQYEVEGVKIFENKQLRVKQPVRPKLERWLRKVPKDDLAEIERIYIMKKGEIEDAGNYTPFLCNINVVWDCPYSRLNPVSFFLLVFIESTLYHEIGHHINKHTFGQDDVQEKEADAYSDYLLRRSNHLLFRVLRTLFDTPPPPVRKKDAGR